MSGRGVRGSEPGEADLPFWPSWKIGGPAVGHGSSALIEALMRESRVSPYDDRCMALPGQ